MCDNNSLLSNIINVIFALIIILEYMLQKTEGIFFSRPSETIVLEKGKTSEVILRCPYVLEQNDLEGLIVSWFYNDLRYPVYQWIPFQKPQVLGFLREHADLSYVSSSRDYYRYRSIRLLSLSTNLTGKYQCKVSSFNDEKTQYVDLVIYSMPTLFNLDVEKKSEDSITVKCIAGGAYPEPYLSLYRVSQSKSIPIGNGRKQTKWSDGTYNVTIEAEIDDVQLDGLTVFECHLTILGTDLALRRTIKYVPQTLPNINQLYSTSSSSNHLPRLSYQIISIFILLLFIV